MMKTFSQAFCITLLLALCPLSWADSPEALLQSSYDLDIQPAEAIKLADSAYQEAAKNPSQHHVAALALQRLVELAPERKLEGLEKLRDLYKAAQRPTARRQSQPLSLNRLIQLSYVYLELSQARVQQVDRLFLEGEFKAKELAQQAEAVVADYGQAVATMQKVVKQAKAQMKAHGDTRPDILDRNQVLLNQFEPYLAKLESDRAHVVGEAHARRDLALVHQQFLAKPDAEAAEDYARVYLCQFDQPEHVRIDVFELLSPRFREMILRACQIPATLTQKQAAQLAQWYDGLIREAPFEYRPTLLVRSRLYLDLAIQEEASVVGLGKLSGEIDIKLKALGFDKDKATQAKQSLIARLDYRFRPDEPEEPVVVATAQTTTKVPSWRSMASAEIHKEAEYSKPVHTTSQSVRSGESSEPQIGQPRVAVYVPSADVADTTKSSAEPANAIATTTTIPSESEAMKSPPTVTDIPIEAEPTTPTVTDSDSDVDKSEPIIVMRDGRPMTKCAACGKEFFAGWGSKETICPHCRGGRRNIFDFGQE